MYSTVTVTPKVNFVTTVTASIEPTSIVVEPSLYDEIDIIPKLHGGIISVIPVTSDDTIRVSAKLYTDMVYNGQYDKFDGDYIVTPKAHSQTVLGTKGKLMESDVTVIKIPYYETSNSIGGNTIYIANEV